VQGLAVALRRAAEVARDLLVGFLALLMPDEHDLVRADAGEAGDDRGVVAIAAVAVEFGSRGNELDVLASAGGGVAGDADGSTGRGRRGLLDEGGAFGLQIADLRWRRASRVLARWVVRPRGEAARSIW
jgi:hypothetical protein